MADPSSSARSVAIIATSAKMYNAHRPQCSATRYLGCFASSRRNSFRVWCGRDVAVVAPSRTDRVCSTARELMLIRFAVATQSDIGKTRVGVLTDSCQASKQHHEQQLVSVRCACLEVRCPVSGIDVRHGRDQARADKVDMAIMSYAWARTKSIGRTAGRHSPLRELLEAPEAWHGHLGGMDELPTVSHYRTIAPVK